MVKLLPFFTVLFLISCNNKSISPIAGTWLLLSGTTIEKGDTIHTDYTKDQKVIKIINETHFSFLRHDLTKGIDSSALFVAGGGKYSLKDTVYSENLEFCNYREWENNTFDFIVEIRDDTLIQRGVEKVKSTNIDRYNIEKYVRLK